MYLTEAPPWGHKSSPPGSTPWHEPSLGGANVTASSLCPANASRCGIDFQAGQPLVVGLYGSVFLLGLATNGLTLGPLLHQVRLGNSLAVYLLSLVLSDLLYLFTLPLWMMYILHGHRWTLGGPACHVAGFLFYSNMYVSIFLLCAISLERCLAVRRPLRSLRFRGRLSAALVSALVALLVFLAHLAILLSSEGLQAASCYDSYPLQPGVAKFVYFRVSAGFALPLLILAVSYLKIVQGVRASETLLEGQKAKVRHLAFGVISLFLLCFAPYHLLLLVRSVAASFLDRCSLCVLEQHLHLPFSLSLAASSFNSALDPVLYVLVSNGVKEDLKRAFGRGPRSYPAQSSVAL
ncbi:probable G-protein coupled receptor 132 [Hemicordylus capensis]|uniref:probable G-protein coupled receptor 132 n=1 Tax=Hemicordylus capensis TaxID=884348 RepID=UPI0023048161|nr:probable G-protein coupled receptor 132 [Hemicordylus capensis]